MRAALAAWVGIAACAGHTGRPGRPGPDETTPPTPEPTDSGNPDSGTPPTPPEYLARSVPPSTVLVGEPATRYDGGGNGIDGMMLGDAMGIVPAHGSDPSVLFLYHNPEPRFQDLPAVLLVPGDLPRGEVSYADVVDGGLDFATNAPWGYSAVDDFDGDGHLDLWVATRMFRGPFLGRDLLWEAADAQVDDLEVSAGGFAGIDADQDGHRDVILTNSGQGRLFYGPLTGVLSAFGPDVSVIGDCLDPGSITLYWPLPDLLGPGLDAFVKSSTTCDSGEVFPTAIARGSILGEAESVAWGYSGEDGYGNEAMIRALGDVDGDGAQDVLAGSAQWGMDAHRGPVAGSIQALPEAIDWVGVTNVLVSQQVGDVNGDGDPDLLVRVIPDRDMFPEVDWDWFVLVLSPLGTSIDPWEVGIPIERYGVQPRLEDAKSGDLDGDGLSDIVVWNDSQDGAGRTSIWYAKDLLKQPRGVEAP